MDWNDVNWLLCEALRRMTEKPGDSGWTFCREQFYPLIEVALTKYREEWKDACETRERNSDLFEKEVASLKSQLEEAERKSAHEEACRNRLIGAESRIEKAVAILSNNRIEPAVACEKAIAILRGTEKGA